MAQQVIGVGSALGDGNGDIRRDAWIKVNENTTELYSQLNTTENIITATQHGIVGDGVTDDTAALITALNSLQSGDTFDLQNKDCNIFVGVAGVASGNALTLAEIPRLYNKSNITIKNGTIRADSPAVSGSKLRYPVTLTVDLCTGITLVNLKLYSKGESYGDADSSLALTKPERAAFCPVNSGTALLVQLSKNIDIRSCQFRLCGSVAPMYVSSSNNVNLYDCFSNAGSLGYGCYAFDSWMGNTTVSGFNRHYSTVNNCSAYKEGYTYGSKGCVLNEDSEVTTEVNGGVYADAYANATSRDLGYAFGAASSQMIVKGATVYNCASVGYIGASTADKGVLIVSDVLATGLTKTAHQNKNASFSENHFKYTNCEFTVVGGGTWAGDGLLSREKTSYAAMPNIATVVRGSFSNCSFRGAVYCFINENTIYGRIKFTNCDIETNGWLYNSNNFGSSGPLKSHRGIIFDLCSIRDLSAFTSAYAQLTSIAAYSHVDLSTSTIFTTATRPVESLTHTNPGEYIQRYDFPQDAIKTETLAGTRTLIVGDAKHLLFGNSAGVGLIVLATRPDKFKFTKNRITNTNSVYNLTVKDYTNTTTRGTIRPGETVDVYNDGVITYVSRLVINDEPTQRTLATSGAILDSDFGNIIILANGAVPTMKAVTDTTKLNRTITFFSDGATELTFLSGGVTMRGDAKINQYKTIKATLTAIGATTATVIRLTGGTA